MATVTTTLLSTPKRSLQPLPSLSAPPRKRLRHEASRAPTSRMMTTTPLFATSDNRGDLSPISIAAFPDSLKLSADMFSDAPSKRVSRMDWSNPRANVPAFSLRPRGPLLSIRPRTITSRIALPTTMALPTMQSQQSRQRPSMQPLQQPLLRPTGGLRRRLSMKDVTRAMEDAAYDAPEAPQEQHQIAPLPRLPRRLSLTSLSSHGLSDFPQLDLAAPDFAGCA
uniref:Uncharacterized protein n=1 Tax=Craspedostauros australis TaxID=1486917 RepID=A0A7R9ZM12_9STRA|mmetsp:Transcript_15868/g.43817  ORF Transcript_15868/g.43817 Transcript_15868/m.43817 type:complete len:224 (+) Transcript_15868:143-814(+)